MNISEKRGKAPLVIKKNSALLPFLFGVRPQLTFLFTVSHECRAHELVKCELNKFILCDMSAFEHEYSQVCL